MPMVTFDLQAELKYRGHEYVVIVEERSGLTARLNVEMHSDKSSDENPVNSQGVELTARDCDALGAHLIAVAARLRMVNIDKRRVRRQSR